MAFIVKQKVYGKDYYYLRKSERKDGKVISKNLGYLGKDKGEAIKKAREIIQSMDEKKEVIELKHKDISVEEMAVFCKRRGFVYPSAEIYGGFAGFWDFGSLGVELKNNIKNLWWDFHVRKREDVAGIDGAIITNPLVWKASGHENNFSDVFVVCKKCKKPNKIDKSELGTVKCDCGGEYDLESAKEVKLMFETNVGGSGKAYLRPETAQLIFTNFKFVQENQRMKLPFGISQIGKSFRNEIAPRDFLFRSREFEQMELQFFIDPKKIDECSFYEEIKDIRFKILTADAQKATFEVSDLSLDEMLNKQISKNKWHAYWLYNSYKWFLGLGISKDNLRLREHRKDELAHYANAAVDIEYNFSFGWKEIFGSHDRGQFDLEQHQKGSKKDLSVFDEEAKTRILPRVIEVSFGVERAFLVFMFDSYFYDQKRENIVLRLNPKLVPVKASVFPIVKRPDFEKIAEDIVVDLQNDWNISYDRSGSIGRRYARNDEIGTPYCITIDEDSLKNKDVTIRNRDTTRQIRVKISKLREILRDLIDGKIDFERAGKLVK
jgi:glycyl-tRNA synthetase